MALITDPDQLNQTTEVVFNTTNRTIDLVTGGNLSTDGVTLQALYSFCKEEWKDDSTLIKFPFPVVSITEQKFDLVNGWTFLDQDAIDLIRYGGFAYKDVANNSEAEYMGFVTLGSLGGSDQVYYQQEAAGSATNVVLTGAANQCVKIYDETVLYGGASGDDGTDFDFTANNTIETTTADLTAFIDGDSIIVRGSTSNDGTYTVSGSPTANSLTIAETSLTVETGVTATRIARTDDDFRSYFKCFVREYQKLYAQAELSDIGQASVTYQVYSFPLANAADLKITHDDTAVSTTTPYTQMDIDYFSSDQLEDVGGSDYNFDIIITVPAGASIEEAYEFVQWSLRQNSDINDALTNGPTGDAGTVNGLTADSLLTFVGDRIVGSTGVYIKTVDATDKNDVEFYDTGATKRTYPYVAAGNLIFNENLTGDANAVYRMYFSDNFGTASALLVEDNTSSAISGTVSANSSISFDFDYENNAQGGRTPDTPAAVTVVAIGLDSAQYVITTGTIQKSTSNSFSLVSSLERNYTT